MNSERLTDRNRGEYRRRIHERNRRIRIRRSIILVVILTVVLLLGFLVFRYIRDHRINNWYEPELRYTNVLTEEVSSDRLPAAFVDVCAPCAGSIAGEDSPFTPAAGIVAHPGEDYVSFDKNGQIRMHPASTTKIMTALVAMEYGDLTEKVTVPQEAVIQEEGTSLAGIKPGDILSLEQLLYGLLLPSGNDCAAAIAMHVGGSIEGFAELMNAEAQRIGAVDSHFTNPHGLTDDNHYTTAYDLYLIFNEALKHEEFLKISGTKEYTAEYFDAEGLALSKNWVNTNKYINGEAAYPNSLRAIAGKTGTTLAAGKCLALASAGENEERYISIVLNAETKEGLYENMDYLLLNFTK